ncbi:cytochrome b N-terminal domain-containing protein [Antribacter sp. KLBMP9083]|uniref:Cytochrome bc1 complex cytochrome b subunit n=1 Tax=Antribacter soli TaxID=2910976 RepID=A0AA41QDE7_9MICO|nr:cytochrome b N-terminal domain-containing protein [Antribacter soli]MCF4121102.1 cytochrome b N-terminal domain-containing protein [Antribacter soli]
MSRTLIVGGGHGADDVGRRRIARALGRSVVWRTCAAAFLGLGRRRVHLHWTSLFGVIAFACLLVLAVTGVLLSFSYTPSSDPVTYRGPYAPLEGTQVTAAFRSMMEISFEQPGGLLLRQTHHWAALVMPAAIVMQILVMFFTGAFRGPRRLSWVVLVALFVVVLVGGWSGYALPDDMLSGTGLRIVEGVTWAIPVIGGPLASWLFGGPFPGEIIEHLYPVHVQIVPTLLALLLAVRAALAVAFPPAELPRPVRPTLGLRLWPDVAVRAAGLVMITAGLLVLLGATSTISPVWSYGPASVGEVSAGSQPDWYMGFLDGALRLVPPGWEAEWFGYTWTFAILVPLAVVGGYFLAVIAYPFLESWVTQDAGPSRLLDRPRNVPVRTGIGVAGIVFYGVLWGAAGADVIDTAFRVTFGSVIGFLQVALVVGPPLAFEITRRICIGLQRRDREVALHGHETGRIVRLADGGYVEVHSPADPAEVAVLAVRPVQALDARPNDDGDLTRAELLRGTLSRAFAEGHVRPAADPQEGTARGVLLRAQGGRDG